ncbi:MAG: GNAT family N-acetyltransferase [Chloroflexota bacterium]|jgi:GNAT superfamily N-acetyltransferase
MADFVIAEEPADSDDVRWCFAQYYRELGALFGYAADQAVPLGAEDLTRPHGLVLIVRRDDKAVGCGALKLLSGSIGEIKRMWIAPHVRGQGLGGRLLEALEAAALAEGRTITRLDSSGRLHRAIAMYRARGYREVPPFNAEPFSTHWLEKRLEVR